MQVDTLTNRKVKNKVINKLVVIDGTHHEEGFLKGIAAGAHQLPPGRRQQQPARSCHPRAAGKGNRDAARSAVYGGNGKHQVEEVLKDGEERASTAVAKIEMVRCRCRHRAAAAAG